MAKNEFWEMVCGVVGGVASAPVGVLNGAIKVIDGGSFGEGFGEVVETVANTCAEFGGEHGAEINKTAVLGIATGAGLLFGKDAYAAIKDIVK